MLEIEKNIPIIPRNSCDTPFSREVRAALAKMETSDSFAYEDGTPSKSLNKTIRHIARTLNIKVTVRDIGEGKFRVWKLS